LRWKDRNFKHVRKIVFLVSLFLLIAQLPAQAQERWSDQVEIIEDYEAETGYLVYLPKAQKNGEVVVFIHGYGAINPMIYGGWIKHLIAKGYVVIYPRYQDKILGTKAKLFAVNVAVAISKAQKAIQEENVMLNGIYHYTGHSYGGAICGYIGVFHEELGLPKPSSILMSQPGTGPLNGLKLNSYEGFDVSIPFAIIVGSKDLTVGESMGRMIYQSSRDSNQKLFIRHKPDNKIDPPITATHYEPYSIDADLDIGYENYTLKKAIQKAKIDEVDRLYWSVHDQLMQQPESLFDNEIALSDHE